MKILKATQKICNTIWIASLVSICYINAHSVFAQTCLPGGISFTTQAQIDAFPTDYPGCTEIQGSVTINDALFGNITNLDGLVQITSILGSLVIVNNGALSSITGLSSLSSISYDVIIDHNNALTNLAGLNLIPAINSTLQISNNNLLSTLSDLSAIATIGTLIINNNNSLINLSGLDNVISINGSLNISNNNNLITLNGLNSLVTVGSLTIDYNNSLTNISALNSIISLSTLSVYNNNLLTNLTGIGTFSTLNTLSIHNNNVLSDISGLTTLTSITGPLYISENSSLTNLTGLNGLTYVNGDLSIQYNYSLNNISALSGINFIDGQLIIKSNNLTSLSGLENINPASITTLYLENSNTLSTCNVQSICEYLSFPNNPASISGNACGCESRTQIETACSGSGCPIGDISLNSQSEIDAFALNYPTCAMITGNLTISESFNGNITNLNGLSQITSITGTLTISGNSALTSLMGLDALSSIGVDLHIYNNNTLTNLTSLSALLSIGGTLDISNNIILTSLSGLDNINPATISYLALFNSPNLSICDNQSICDYLAIPSNQAQIYNNASGCYTREDIESKCIGCPLGDVYLTSQAQIDAFIVDYPTCNTILASLTINDNNSGSITNLNGLDNITTINGELTIQNNSALTDVAGLDALTSILGGLIIRDNSILTNISGLLSVNTIGGQLRIQSNPQLTSMTGLNAINTLGAGISITGNPTLTNLSNLFSIITINGYISIGNNNALTSLSGLDNITYSSITGLEIYYSNELSICDVPSICDFINLSSNYRNISGNSLGCNSESEVSISCSGCPVGDVTFSTQAEIDLFPITYPTCTQIYGNLYIDDNGSGDITDLSPLTQLTSVSGNLYITNNSALTQLSGLNSLTSIAGSLNISNNATLIDLSAMTTLTTISGDLNLNNNLTLTNLTGLDNINPSGITNLILQSSTLLATCDVTSICNYLANPSNPASISDNALGCNSRPNVESVCNGCPSGDISFSTQLEIDNFPIAYPGCSHVFGNITIDDGGSGNITSLSNLSQLTTVEGNFTIQNTNALPSMTGLSGLNFIGGNLIISDNSDLEDFLGLDNLVGTGGDLTISSNNSLINLTGLTSLTWIEGSFTINSNNSLVTLDGLNNLVSIVGSLSVANNPILTNLANLSQVSYFQGFLAIQNNPGLTSLSGLDNIPYLNITSLSIENSSLLSICQLQNICNYLTYTSNPTSIFGNAPGCLTRGQVQAYCTDQDNDNTIDSLDNCATIYNPLQEDADTDMVGDACDFGTQDNVGIGTELPVTKLQISQGVMFTDNNNGSLLMRSPDNTCWILKVSNFGELTAKKVPCPE